MSLKLWFPFAVILGFLVGACAQQELPEEPASTPGTKLPMQCLSGQFQDSRFNAIVAGQTVFPSSWIARSTVFVLRVDQQETEYSCTGTLISDRVVLTAAHCVEGATPRQVYVFFSSQPECDNQNKQLTSKVVLAERVISHPSYRSGNRQGQVTADLAMIRLAQPAPSTHVPIALSNGSPSEDTSRVLVAGYGKTAPGTLDNEDPLVLRATILRPVSTGGEFLVLDQRSGRGTCKGDSGGPAFIMRGGQPVQAGVASHVTYESGRPETMCLKTSLYTNVLFHRSWLNQTFAQLTGPRNQPLF